jgi:hypothetical protein
MYFPSLVEGARCEIWRGPLHLPLFLSLHPQIHTWVIPPSPKLGIQEMNLLRGVMSGTLDFPLKGLSHEMEL